MRRGVFDTLRRGVDNTIANWQISLIRLGETMLFAGIVVGAIILMVLPILVSIGIQFTDLGTPGGLENAIQSLFGRGMILIWIFLILFALLLVFIAMHAFVEAGCARVIVDADRVAGPAVAGPRSRYAVFSMDRWLTGAKDGFWSVFWIYNFVWGVGGLVLLVPLVPAIFVIWMLRGNTGAAIALGCLTLAVVMLMCLVIAIVLGMWANRAIVEWAVRRAGIRESIDAGWRFAMRTDLGRHLLITLAIIVAAMAGSTVFASFSMMASFGESMSDHGVFNVITLPLRLAGTFLNWAFSSLITTWYLASYAALGVEGRSDRP
ncbi:MAG TPA: hypothetical protein VNA69_13495 [Thermoanaerobaculia bacterium]|nr:hypothetical protein [Thermoanaerobaculia bacterium]